jgi:hypothetical protein
MMLVYIFLVAAAFGATTISAEAPISCLSLNYTGYFRDSDQFNLTVSGNFALSIINGTTYATASNLSIYNSVINAYATGVCYYSICCNITAPGASCTFDVRDAYILLYANFSSGPTPTVFTGIIADDGTFSTNKLFTPSKMCLSTSGQENTTYTGNTICCTSSVPAPVVTTNHKRCKRFTSRTTIYNIVDNYSIFSTSSLIYDVVGRTLYPRNLTDQAAPNYFVCYFDHTYFNNPLSCDQKGQVTYANITMDSGDTKFLISTFYLPYAEIFGINGILSARLLYRNDQLLMQEGVPFTPQNNCLYLKGPWYPSPTNYSTTANFCCSAFES